MHSVSSCTHLNPFHSICNWYAINLVPYVICVIADGYTKQLAQTLL